MTQNNENNPHHQDYFSYLLRLWRTRVEGQAIWRASVECPHSGRRLGFANLDELWAFLLEQTGADQEGRR